MSKHTHHQSKEEQTFHKAREALDSKTVVMDDSPIQLRAYQIHEDKGGSELDNWLEAELILKNIEHDTNSLSTANRRGSGGGG